MQVRLLLIAVVFRASHGITWLSGNSYGYSDTTCTTLGRGHLIRPIDTCWKGSPDKWYKLTCTSTHVQKHSFSDTGCTTDESMVAEVALGTDTCVQSPEEYDYEFSAYSKFECQIEHDDYVKIRLYKYEQDNITCDTFSSESYTALNYCVQVGAGGSLDTGDAKSAQTLWKWNQQIIATYHYSDTACTTMTNPVREWGSLEPGKCVDCDGGTCRFADTASATAYAPTNSDADGSQKFGTVAVAVSAALLGHLVAM